MQSQLCHLLANNQIHRANSRPKWSECCQTLVIMMLTLPNSMSRSKNHQGVLHSQLWLRSGIKDTYYYISTLSILIHSANLSLYQSSANFVLTIIMHLGSLYFGQYQITKYGCLTVGHRFLYCFTYYGIFYVSHLFSIWKSCTCNVLVQFWYQLCFITSCPLPEISLLLIPIPLALLLFWNWDNRRAGQHSTYAEAKVPLIQCKCVYAWIYIF